MSNEQQNTREATRQKSLDELHAKQFVEGRDLRFYGAGFDQGFDAGAASVDRVEIVREAFELLEFEILKRRPNAPPPPLYFAERNRVIAAMEKGK